MSRPLPITNHANGLVGDAMKSEQVRRIKQLLEGGQYRIDPYVIADAIIRWAGLSHELPPPPTAQKSCSKPAGGGSASVNTAAAGPASTDPIQVKPAFAGGEL
jgi:hypothetical protein